MRFQELREWSGPGLESDRLWEGVLNRSQYRFVKIQDPQKLNIPFGMTKPGDKNGTKHGHYYSISSIVL